MLLISASESALHYVWKLFKSLVWKPSRKASRLLAFACCGRSGKIYTLLRFLMAEVALQELLGKLKEYLLSPALPGTSIADDVAILTETPRSLSTQETWIYDRTFYASRPGCGVGGVGCTEQYM
jgi:hypothetical protein